MAQEAKVTLQSSDDELFEVNEPVALESQTIKNIVEDIGTATAIPLPHVSGKMLFKVIEYCKFHVEAQNLTDDEIKTWDEEFVKVDTATLLDLSMAAHYLNIKKLLDLTCHTVVNMMNG